MSKSGLKDGVEYPDPTPVEIPSRLRIPQRQVDRIRDMVRHEMSQRAQAAGAESFEEADDFEMDDVEFTSPYEDIFEPPPDKVVDKEVKKEDDDDAAIPQRRKGDDNGRRRKTGSEEVSTGDGGGDGNVTRRRRKSSVRDAARDQRREESSDKGTDD